MTINKSEGSLNGRATARVPLDSITKAQSGKRGSPGTSQGPTRADRILVAATRLIREHGFHGVSIDEIGRAAGITGPGVYRHFASKDDILHEILHRATEQMLEGAEEITSRGLSREETLDELVRFHTRFVLDHPDLVAVYFYEINMVGRGPGVEVRRRKRLYVEHFVGLLSDMNHDVSDELLHVTANGALSFINSVVLYARGFLGREHIESYSAALVSGLLSSFGTWEKARQSPPATRS